MTTDDQEIEALAMQSGSSAVRRIGTAGHEILADGSVIGWAVDAAWAALIAVALNRAEEEGLLDCAGKTLWANEISDAPPRETLENCRDEMKEEETKWGT
jgi:hypothetical protein